MGNTRWEDIYKHLKGKGVAVYSPSQHSGNCTSEYVVIKSTAMNNVPGTSSTRQGYDVLCYVPKYNYSRLDAFVDEITEYMKELKPMIMPVGTRTASFYDESVMAHMISIQYSNNRRIFN